MNTSRDVEEQRCREEHDKELVLTCATIECQKEVDQVAQRESQEKSAGAGYFQDTSEHADPQPPSKPLTTGMAVALCKAPSP